MLNKLADEVHALAVNMGWWDEVVIGKTVVPRSLGDQISNFHAEISEAWEEYRNGNEPDEIYYNNGKPEGFPVELADLIIRVLDTCAAYHIDIDGAVRIKHEYNKTRPFRHGGKKA
jgi:hypothetical protein